MSKRPTGSNVLLISDRRPEPPQELTADQAAEWKAIVARMPAGWFARETWPLLVQLVRHISAARGIARMLDRHWENYGLETLALTLRMQERESKAIATLATKLRLSQQSSYNAKTAATAKANRAE